MSDSKSQREDTARQREMSWNDYSIEQNTLANEFLLSQMQNVDEFMQQ
jgi:hypothetical protein